MCRRSDRNECGHLVPEAVLQRDESFEWLFFTIFGSGTDDGYRVLRV